MAFERRQYAGNAKATTTTSALGTGDTSIACTDLTNWPDGSVGPFFVTLDRGLSGEEHVKCTGRTGNTLTGVTRGADGTAAATHLSGAAIEHTSAKTDFDEANQHYSDVTLNHHTQYPLKSLWSAKGTLLAASAASTPAALAVGTDGQVLTADAASAGGVKWVTAGNGLLSHVQYAPTGGAVTKTFGGVAAVAAIDTTNMRLPDFAAPASGLVRVTIGGFVYLATGDTLRPAVCVVTQGTTTCIGALMEVEAGATAYGHPFHVEEYVTVTAGTTYHWDVGGASNSSGAQLYCYGGTTVGTLGGPLVCSVFSA